MRKANLSKIAGLDTISFEGENSDTCVIIFHGYGADNKDLASLAHHIPGSENQSWYFPNGILEVPISPFMTGRAWFPIDLEDFERAQATGTFRDYSKKRQKGFDEALEKINELYFHLSGKYKKVILGGFSQGAMVATELALKNSDEIQGLMIFSGVLVNEELWGLLIKEANTINFIQSHGAQDEVLSVEGARSLYELLKNSNHKGDYYEFSGGHEIPMECLTKAGSFLKELS